MSNNKNFITINIDKIVFTRRERECLLYVLKGLTFKNIGKKLGLSHRTIESYVKSIRMKVGANSRKELVAKIVDKDGLRINRFCCDDIKSEENIYQREEV